MKRKRWPLWFSIIGGLLVLPEALWLASSSNRLSEHDTSVALMPLTRIAIDGIEKWPASFALVITETKQWNRIRSAWGDPEFVLSVVDRSGRDALCLQETPLHSEIIDATGKPIPLRRGFGPYAYSSSCQWSGPRFDARAGSKFELNIENTGGQTAPAAEITVVADWYNTKDKLVGISLDREMASILKWPCLLGVLFLSVGAVSLARKPHPAAERRDPASRDFSPACGGRALMGKRGGVAGAFSAQRKIVVSCGL